MSSRRDFVDIDAIKQIDIAKGPVSALWGSDALGGVVSYATLDPNHYLDDNKQLHTGLKTSHTSVDDGSTQAFTLAGGAGKLSALVRYTQRQASEIANAASVDVDGPTRETPDPQSINTSNLVVKTDLTLNDNLNLGLTLDQYDNEVDAQLRSDYGTSVFGTIINSRDAIDTRDRNRVSLDLNYDNLDTFVSAVRVGVYRQASESIQQTREHRTSRGAPQTRRRDSMFDQEIHGWFAQVSSEIQLQSVRHVLTFGLDSYRTENASLREGGTYNAEGVPQREFSAFPTRDFPLTEVEQFAFFIQDEIGLLNGHLRVTPSLRYDSFDAKSKADEFYINGNLGQGPPVDYDSSATSGKLAAIYEVSPNVSIYGNFSQGFRAPPYDDVNVGFANLLGGYKTISNEELESETSAGIEAGLRLINKDGFVQFATYRTDYDNFIESFANAPAFASSGGIDPADGLLTFQSINRASVTISGFELSGRLNLEQISPVLSNFNLRFALASATGDDTELDEPLKSIEPLNVVTGVRYESSDNRWGSELILTVAAGKDESDLPAESTRHVPDGYSTLDFLAHRSFANRFTVNLGLFNITDEQYIRWIDTAGIGNDAPLRFTQPGRNVALSLRLEI